MKTIAAIAESPSASFADQTLSQARAQEGLMVAPGSYGLDLKVIGSILPQQQAFWSQIISLGGTPKMIASRPGLPIHSVLEPDVLNSFRISHAAVRSSLILVVEYMKENNLYL
ncbi:MAG: hypothetical protein KGL35_25085 [Bradyrhizobium sp.]|nr:hypothetical protein [Bradyrhizobium sp.]